MKHPDATTIRQLIQKLESEDDISLKEADQIFSLFRKMQERQFLIPTLPILMARLVEILTEWYEAVGEKIRNGKRGNFIFTICLDYDKKFFNKLLLPARKALRERGKPEDSYNVITTGRKDSCIFSSLFFLRRIYPPILHMHLPPALGIMKQRVCGQECFVIPLKQKGGVLTISQFMKNMDNLSCCPVPVPHGHIASSFINRFFYVMAGTEVPQGPYDFDRIELKSFIIGSLMRRDNISCIAVSSQLFSESSYFRGKRQSAFYKRSLEHPL